MVRNNTSCSLPYTVCLLNAFWSKSERRSFYDKN